jgi:acyl-CoA synthetase (NDP forming)
MPAPDAPTAQALNALELPDAVLDRNPIDVTLAGLRPEVLRTVINTLLASPTYDALIVIVGASGIGQPDLVARPVIEAAQATDKPIIVYVSPEAPRIVQHLNHNGVPAFAAPESCAAALAALLTKQTAFGSLGRVASHRPIVARGPASHRSIERGRKQAAVRALRYSKHAGICRCVRQRGGSRGAEIRRPGGAENSLPSHRAQDRGRRRPG